MTLSLVALLVVVFLVMKLTATQTQALRPAAGGAVGSAPMSPATRAADLVNKAVEQGAAMRAADAASQ